MAKTQKKTTWILLADGGGARLFQTRNGQGLELLLSVPHPAGRMQNQELDSDRDGRSFQSTGGSSHVVASEHDTKSHAVDVFVHDLAELLRDGRVGDKFQALVLVAEPTFLGRLRYVLDKSTYALVSGEIAKDLMGVADTELPRFLREVVAIAEPPLRPRAPR